MFAAWNITAEPSGNSHGYAPGKPTPSVITVPSAARSVRCASLYPATFGSWIMCEIGFIGDQPVAAQGVGLNEYARLSFVRAASVVPFHTISLPSDVTVASIPISDDASVATSGSIAPSCT